MVIIVDDPKLGITEENLKAHMGDGPCQHLRGNKPGEYYCAIHDEPWYEETPCARHGQIEHGNTNCRTGEYMLKQLKEKK
jgi:hypothetical protein